MKIGVTLPQAETDQGEVPRYAEIRRAALRAERDGFDSVWLMDHLLFQWEGQPPRGVWEALTLLSALAEATERVELGVLVICTAFRNPGLLAKMAESIDEISNGRLILGLGAGWHEPEFTAFGYPFDHLASRFEEAVAIIAPLLRTGAVDFEGTYERAPECVSRPRGPRPEGPPILMGTQGPRLLRLAARTADAWNTAWLGRAAELPDELARLHAACAEVGRDPASIEITVGQIAMFAGLEPEGAAAEAQPPRHLFADPADLASEWRAFADCGVGHMIVWKMPDTAEVNDCVSEALRLFRNGNPA